MVIPASQQLIASLINQLSISTTVPPVPAIRHPAPLNPPTNIASLYFNAQLRPLMLTLHATFPDTLLPALDLLDRGLVTRFILDPSDTSIPLSSMNEATMVASRAPQAAAGPTNPRRADPRADPISSVQPFASLTSQSVYYVRSATPISSSSHVYTSAHHYEVRLSAWNCTCPAFVFSAFKEPDLFEGSTPSSIGFNWGNAQFLGWKFGGLSKETEEGGDVPLCKHLLACLLGEKGGAVCERMVEVRMVKWEEWVGWGSGWGD